MMSKISLNSLTKDETMLASYPNDRLLQPAMSLAMATSLIDCTLPLKQKHLV